mgnify:CR=1 FL=1
MTSVEIKNQIIHKLQSIEDMSFLEAVNKIIDAKTEKDIFYINEDLKKKILDRETKNSLIDNDDVFNESEIWLNER